MIEIPLTQGQIAIVDDIDADLADFKWFARFYPNINNYYAVRNIRTSNGKLTSEYMHRVILERIVGRPLTRKDKTDHQNHNTLDNRRIELRLATNAQNMSNRKAYGKHGYKGVTDNTGYGKKVKPYRAQITVNRKTERLGSYVDIEDAARAYDAVAIKVFGKFAVLNFPEDYGL